MRLISPTTYSLSSALLKVKVASAFPLVAAFSFHPFHHHHQIHRRSISLLRLCPSQQHPLLPLPDPAPTEDWNTASTSKEESASEIQNSFLKSNIHRVAFIRHGNTAAASVDFERTLTELGRSQSRVAGASYGVQELYPYYEKAALCSAAPRCVETAKLFLQSSLRELENSSDKDKSTITTVMLPSLKLKTQLYDGTVQPEGSRLFRSIGYAPLREYLECKNEVDAEAARCVLGEYGRVSLNAIWDVARDHHHLQTNEDTNEEQSVPETNKHRSMGKTLLFFAHAIYLPSAALAFAAAIGCGGGGVHLILDTNTKEAEGYCVHIDTRSISLLQRPEE